MCVGGSIGSQVVQKGAVYSCPGCIGRYKKPWLCSCGYQACLAVLGTGGWVVQERVGIGGWPVWFVGTGGWAVHKQVGNLVGPGCVIAGTDGWTCAVVGRGLGSGCGYRRRAM